MPFAPTAAQQAALRRDTSLYGAAGGNLIQDIQDLQAQIDALGLQTAIAVATFANEAAETSNYIEIDVQVNDVEGNPLTEAFYCEVVVCDTDDPTDESAITPATILAGSGAEGSILAGSGTAAVLCVTDATGLLALKITETAAAHRYLFVRPCYGSPPLDCRERADLTFA